MRKLILFACVISLSACARENAAPDTNETYEGKKSDKLHMLSNESYGQSIYEDVETGCQYFSSYQGGTFPRIDSDGKTHKGCKNGS